MWFLRWKLYCLLLNDKHWGELKNCKLMYYIMLYNLKALSKPSEMSYFQELQHQVQRKQSPHPLAEVLHADN